MKLTEFIKAHGDWEELLTRPPYCIKIKREDGYIIFSYNQLESDFDIELVRECRGVILDEKTLRPVCVPFFKFGNYGESYAATLDWGSARVQEKIDGSIIKVWYDREKWRVSTNGNIVADNAVLTRTDLFDDDCTFGTFGELFAVAKEKRGLDFDKLDKDKTYMFELIGPYNKVVILYPNIDIYHIGTRDNTTLKELDVDIGVQKPREYPLRSIEQCIAASRELPDDKEGYVAVDKYYNRVKIKNPTYVALHHYKNNGTPSLTALIEIVRKNEAGEYLTYFPEFRTSIERCKSDIEKILAELQAEVDVLKGMQFATQKDFALYVKEKPLCGYYFEWNKNRALTPKEWFWRMPDEKIRRILENSNN